MNLRAWLHKLNERMADCADELFDIGDQDGHCKCPKGKRREATTYAHGEENRYCKTCRRGLR